jgi:hypothetical protein
MVPRAGPDMTTPHREDPAAPPGAPICDAGALSQPPVAAPADYAATAGAAAIAALSNDEASFVAS